TRVEDKSGRRQGVEGNGRTTQTSDAFDHTDAISAAHPFADNGQQRRYCVESDNSSLELFSRCVLQGQKTYRDEGELLTRGIKRTIKIFPRLVQVLNPLREEFASVLGLITRKELLSNPP